MFCVLSTSNTHLKFYHAHKRSRAPPASLCDALRSPSNAAVHASITHSPLQLSNLLSPSLPLDTRSEAADLQARLAIQSQQLQKLTDVSLVVPAISAHT